MPLTASCKRVSGDGVDEPGSWNGSRWAPVLLPANQQVIKRSQSSGRIGDTLPQGHSCTPIQGDYLLVGQTKEKWHIYLGMRRSLP
jgi:hypothetical protein